MSNTTEQHASGSVQSLVGPWMCPQCGPVAKVDLCICLRPGAGPDDYLDVPCDCHSGGTHCGYCAGEGYRCAQCGEGVWPNDKLSHEEGEIKP